MISDPFRKTAAYEYPILAAIMALSFLMAFIPRIGYPYPLHIDEWVHMAYAEGILRAQDTTFTDPFLGQSQVNLSTHLETGFQLFWAVFHQLSGVSWMAIFRYFPGIMSMVIALSVYVLGRREGFGLEAAFFAALIPTRIGIMGPGILVPVVLGLTFVSLALFLVFHFRTVGSYLALFAVTAFVMAMHPPSALLIILALAPFILLSLKDDFRHALGAFLAVSAPFLVTLPWISRSTEVKNVIDNLFTRQPLPAYHELLGLLDAYGEIPMIFALLGILLMVLRGGRRNHGIVLGLVALQALVMVYYSLHYGVGILFLRAFHYLMLMAAIAAGAGLVALRRLQLPGLARFRARAPLVASVAGLALSLAVIGLTLATAVPQRQKVPFYHMIADEDYAAFVWVRDNVGGDYQKAILDPWKATAFVAITGKYVYTRTHVSPTPTDEEAKTFLRNGATDTGFLRKNGISIIYTQGNVNNPDLAEGRQNIYLLKQAAPR